jgi:hypothetical protein
MSIQEKRTMFSIITGILILVAYCIYAYGKYQSGTIAADDMKFWAGTMLIFVGVGVVATIIGQIVFHVLLAVTISVREKMKNEKCNDKEIEKTIKNEMIIDEMEKLIELKSMRIGFAVSGMGFVAGLIFLVLNYSPAVMINIIFLSFCVGSLLEGFSRIYYYRKGV